MLAVAAVEFVKFFFRRKERFHPVRLCQRRFVYIFQLPHEMHEGERFFFKTAKSRADGDIDLGVFRRNDLIVAQMQRPGKLLAQLGKEGKRSAQEADCSPDRSATGKACNGLQDDGLEYGSCYIFLAGTIIEEGLYVRFGENTAAGGNRVQGIRFFCQCIEAAGVGVQECRHLIDECACPAGAITIHTVFVTTGKIGNFCIFPAEFDDDV